MIHEVFTVHDAKADAFLPPWIVPKAQMAQRVFSDCISSNDHQFAKHPEDYTLFCLGNFDDATGKYDLLKAPLSLGNGVEYVRQEDMFGKETDNGQAQIPFGDDSPIQPSTEGGDPAE